MIQLANDPHASPQGFGAARHHGQAAQLQAAPGRRSGHAWPFPSRYAARPDSEKRPSGDHINGDSGS